MTVGLVELLEEAAGSVALAGFAVAAGASLLAGAEPLEAVVRGAAAFAGILVAGRWAARVCGALAGEREADEER